MIYQKSWGWTWTYYFLVLGTEWGNLIHSTVTVNNHLIPPSLKLKKDKSKIKHLGLEHVPWLGQMPPTSTDWCRTISSCCFFILCSCRYIQQTQNTKWAAWPKKHRISECFLGETMVSCNTSRKNNPTIRPFWSILSFALRTSIWWYLHISLLHVFLHHMLNGSKHVFLVECPGW